MNCLDRLAGASLMYFCAMATLPAQQKAKIVVPAANRLLPMAATLGPVSANPGTISFTATDPDLGSVSGSSAATISWTTSNGSSGSTWTLKVHASAASFTNCGTVPVSAVTVTCSSVSGGSAGACSPAITLATSARQVASGRESTATNAPYSVSLNFTLADSWSYIAQQAPACTLTLTYTVTAP